MLLLVLVKSMHEFLCMLFFCGGINLNSKMLPNNKGQYATCLCIKTVHLLCMIRVNFQKHEMIAQGNLSMSRGLDEA